MHDRAHIFEIVFLLIQTIKKKKKLQSVEMHFHLG